MADDPRLRPFPHKSPPKPPTTEDVLTEIRDAIRQQVETNRALLRFLTGVSDPE